MDVIVVNEKMDITLFFGEICFKAATIGATVLGGIIHD